MRLNSLDIVIFINSSTGYINNPEGMVIDLLEEYNKEDRKTYFAFLPIHVNEDGARMAAGTIYNKFISKKIAELESQKGDLLYSNEKYLQKGELLSDNMKESLKNYLNRIIRFNSPIKLYKNAGGGVMNCNPFTLGHQYLIEKAAAQADYLYVFIVQEERSLFSFADRYEMAKRGTQHLPNVIVNPNGNYMISYQTMPVYFEKEVLQDKEVNMTDDIELFAGYIAPELGITIRFVGEEPTDNITRQYNEQMKIILQKYGIALCEIPRKKIKGEYISASLVRKNLKSGDWPRVQEMIPPQNEDICRKYLQIV